MKMLQKQCLVMCVALTGLVGCVTKAPTDGAMVTVQSRTLPERMIDFGIQRNIINGLANVSGVSKDNSRVAVTSFRGEVLLTGEVPNEQVKADIEKMALSIREVKALYNYLEVVDTPKSQSHSNHERYLLTKIRTKLISSSLSALQYKLVVRSDVAYVMGEMTQSQQEEIIEAIRTTEGIKGVVLANKILSVGDVNNVYANTNDGSNVASNAGYDDSAVYPSNAAANQSNAQYSPNTQYNSNAGYPNTQYNPNGQYGSNTGQYDPNAGQYNQNTAPYNPNTGYPNSMYTNNGQPNYNAPQTAPTYQPPANNNYNPNASSGYVQLYQGTNQP